MNCGKEAKRQRDFCWLVAIKQCLRYCQRIDPIYIGSRPIHRRYAKLDEIVVAVSLPNALIMLGGC